MGRKKRRVILTLLPMGNRQSTDDIADTPPLTTTPCEEHTRAIGDASDTAMAGTSAIASRVLQDHVGMLPYIMTFLSQSDKMLRVALVCKSFRLVVRQPNSWRTVDVGFCGHTTDNCTIESAKIDRIVSNGTSRARRFSMDDMPSCVNTLTEVRHINMAITQHDAVLVAVKWPLLQTLHIYEARSPPDGLHLLATALRSLTQLRVLNIELLFDSEFEPVLEWPAFRSVERFKCGLNRYTCKLIVEHGDGLKHLTVPCRFYADDISRELECLVDVVKARGSQLTSLFVNNARLFVHDNEQPGLLDCIAKHSGRLEVVHIAKICMNHINIDELIRVVDANRLTLRAVSFEIRYGGDVAFPLRQLVEAVHVLCQGRVHYLNIDVAYLCYDRKVHAHYPALPNEAVLSFRYILAFVNMVSFVEKRYHIDPLYSNTDALEMYRDGLSPYPVRK
jgi:hypothetical protein